MDVRTLPVALGAGMVLMVAGCTATVPEPVAVPAARVSIEGGPPGSFGDYTVLAPERVEGQGVSGVTPQVRVSRDGSTLWYGQGLDLCEKLSAVATVTGDEVQIAQRLTPNPDAPAACVAGDALPVVVVHLAKPLEGELVRVTVMP